MFNHSDQFTAIPPAWSLGAETGLYFVSHHSALSCTVVDFGDRIGGVRECYGATSYGLFWLSIASRGALTFFVLGSFLIRSTGDKGSTEEIRYLDALFHRCICICIICQCAFRSHTIAKLCLVWLWELRS